MFLRVRSALLSLASGALVATALAADGPPTADAAGATDHPLLRRFTGSLLVGYQQQAFGATVFPSAQGVSKTRDEFASPQNLEGKITRLFYLSPLGKGPLEVFRNHQKALMAAGFKPVWGCETEAQGCAKAYFALDKYERMRGMGWSPGQLPGQTEGWKHAAWNVKASISHLEGRFMAAKLSRGGQSVDLMLYTSAAENEYTQRTATYIEIVEPKAMPTGQVTVDAQAIGQGLRDEGKVALYGVRFDTGKTDLLPDSQAQLDQMAAVLKAQPALRVFIVGHTDNVGALDANLALSQGRAQAVVAALTQRGIAASRLQARGVANLAPVASNASDEGRAKNRRVEMVLQ